MPSMSCGHLTCRRAAGIDRGQSAPGTRALFRLPGSAAGLMSTAPIPTAACPPFRRNSGIRRGRRRRARAGGPAGRLALRRDRRRLGRRARRTAGVRAGAGRPRRLRAARHLARLLGDARDGRHHGDLAAQHAGADHRDGRRHHLGDGLPEIRARLGHALGAVRGRARRARAGDGARAGHRRERARDRDGADRAAVHPGGRAADRSSRRSASPACRRRAAPTRRCCARSIELGVLVLASAGAGAGSRSASAFRAG